MQQNLDVLVDLEASSEGAAAGDTLVHFDLRADNIVLNGRDVFFVDWPHARTGETWLDVAYFLPRVAMQGGPSPNELFWEQLAFPRRPTPRRVLGRCRTGRLNGPFLTRA